MRPRSPVPTPRAARIFRGRALLNALLIALAISAFVLLLIRNTPSPGVEIEVRDPPPGVDEIRVYLSGAVVEPGVISVDPGDRIADALVLVGGPTEDADLAAVNLARRVLDEDHVHVPRIGEADPLIDINRATGDELQWLPGIGPVRADQILLSRAEEPFATTDELVERGILPASVYEGLRDLITAGGD